MTAKAFGLDGSTISRETQTSQSQEGENNTPPEGALSFTRTTSSVKENEMSTPRGEDTTEKEPADTQGEIELSLQTCSQPHFVFIKI